MAILSKIESAVLQRSFLSCKKTKSTFNTDAFLIRLKHSGEGPRLHGALSESYQKNSLHKTSIQEYPEAKQLTLPSNIEDIASSEKLQFSPQRARDISGSFISSISSANVEAKTQKTTTTHDARVASYDCSNAVNLSSAMQTNVPDPFKSKGKATHLYMPGGQWGQGEKYMSEDLNNSHHINTRNTRTIQSGGSMFQAKGKRNTNSYLFDKNIERNDSWLSFLMFQPKNFYSTAKGEKIEEVKEGNKIEEEKKGDDKTETSEDGNKQLTVRQKLQAAVKDYGSVALVFHISISLMSLGICFLVVYSGIDLSYFTQKWGNSDGAAAAGVAAQFVVAYAIHKAMAPGRIAVTLASVPVIVKFLRKKGLIKYPTPK